MVIFLRFFIVAPARKPMDVPSVVSDDFYCARKLYHVGTDTEKIARVARSVRSN